MARADTTTDSEAMTLRMEIEALRENERMIQAAITEVIGMLEYGSPHMALATLKKLKGENR